MRGAVCGHALLLPSRSKAAAAAARDVIITAMLLLATNLVSSGRYAMNAVMRHSSAPMSTRAHPRPSRQLLYLAASSPFLFPDAALAATAGASAVSISFKSFLYSLLRREHSSHRHRHRCASVHAEPTG